MKLSLSHVALLVPSVRRTAERLAGLGFSIGDEEVWEGENTREIYVGREKANSLLLMEPVGAGAYQRAMDKRGPGLHHIGIDVLSLELFLESLKTTSWKVHDVSAQTIRKTRTAWLYQKGFPALLEIQERPEVKGGPYFVSELKVPLTADFELDRVGLAGFVSEGDGQMTLDGIAFKWSSES